MTATPEQVRDQVLDDVLDGTAEIQIGDRRFRNMSPAERLQAIREADSATKTPFIKVGFRARSI